MCMQSMELNNSHENPMPEQSTIDRKNSSSRNRNKRAQFSKDFNSPAEQCMDGCCTPEVKQDEDTSHNEPNDTYPPPTHWKTLLDEAIKMDGMNHKAPLLPGCGHKCGYGIHHLTERRAFTMTRSKYDDPSEKIAMSARLDVEFTSTDKCR